MVFQPDFHRGFQKSELIPRVVRFPFVNIREQPSLLRQQPQRIRQLDLAPAPRLGPLETIEDFRRQQISPGHARAILGTPDRAYQEVLAKAAIADRRKTARARRK